MGNNMSHGYRNLLQIFPKFYSHFSLTHGVKCVCNSVAKEKVKHTITSSQTLDLRRICDTPHFHKTLKITLGLMIAKKTIDFDAHRKKNKEQSITSFSSCIYSYWSFDPCAKVLTPCALNNEKTNFLLCIQALTHSCSYTCQGLDTL